MHRSFNLGCEENEHSHKCLAGQKNRMHLTQVLTHTNSSLSPYKETISKKDRFNIVIISAEFPLVVNGEEMPEVSVN